MHLEDITAERGDDGMAAVDDHVERERDIGRRCDRADVVVHRVPLRDAPTRVGVPDARRVVQRQCRLETREAGCDHLRTTREAGEEVRLDETCRDPHVGGEPLGVQPHRDVRPESSDPCQ